MARFKRHDIKAMVDSLSGRLDQLGGDPTLRIMTWLSALDGRGEYPTDNGGDPLPELPLYGVDQSHGPLNEERAYQRWQTAVEANGLSLSGLARSA